MSNNPFSKLNREISLSEKVEGQILKAIRQKLFVPGDKLPGEMELAETFGVSRTAVREALNRLIGRGVAESKKGSGVYVAVAKYSTVTDSFYHLLEMKCGNSSLMHIAEVRLIMEPEIAKIAAASRKEDDIVILEDCYASMKDNFDVPDQMIEYDIRFHRQIGLATQNQLVPVIMEPIYQLLNKFISNNYAHPSSLPLALERHGSLLDCIRKKDGDRAYQTMRQHMLEAYAHAKSLLE